MPNGKPCRCGPGVVHEPLPPDWLDKLVAKSPECNRNGIVLDRCYEFYGDGACKRCGKRKGAK